MDAAATRKAFDYHMQRAREVAAACGGLAPFTAGHYAGIINALSSYSPGITQAEWRAATDELIGLQRKTLDVVPS